jgi:serine/threonine-protein kinase
MMSGECVGAYHLKEQIGVGGMGKVYLAEHTTLGRPAAIKVLHPEFSNRPEVVTRFFNEARAATAIRDPGIVQIFDFGHHTDGSAYIVMELLDGEPLDRRLARVGTLELLEALRIMRQAASTLGAAHARGIVHRDLKPENIFIVRDPEVHGGERAKVLDFGIAKLIGDHGVKTQTTAVIGTPMYMSPEQCRGAGQVDQRSDVYALGCVLFALVVGRPPFQAEGVGDLIAMHLREPAPTASHLRTGIPPEIDDLLLRCLAKDPAERFANAGELAIAIGALTGSSPQVPVERWTGSMPIAAYTGGMPVVRYSTKNIPLAGQATGSTPGSPAVLHSPASAAPPTTLSAAAGASPTTPRPPIRRKPVVVIGGAATAAIIGAAVVIFATKGGEQPPLPRATDTTRAGLSPLVAVSAPQPVPPSQHIAPATPEGTGATPPTPTPESPEARVAVPMGTVLARFIAWSRGHAGAPCPDVVALGITVADPWAHPFRITCIDQPDDQMVGVISAGPDGVMNTADDLVSWRLGNDLGALVRGPRWAAPPQPRPETPSPPPLGSQHPSVPTSAGTPPPTQPVQPVGVQYDANGMPISR